MNLKAEEAPRGASHATPEDAPPRTEPEELPLPIEATFHITNLRKKKSLYAYGLKPFVWSMQDQAAVRRRKRRTALSSEDGRPSAALPRVREGDKG